MAVLKLVVPYQVVGRLLDELDSSPNELQIVERYLSDQPGKKPVERRVNFARVMPGDRKSDGRNVELVLELVEKYTDLDADEEVQNTFFVSRGMLLKLCDKLGYFPPSDELPEDVAVLLRSMYNAVSMIGSIAENQIGREDIRKQILESVMEFYTTERELSRRLGKLL